MARFIAGSKIRGTGQCSVIENGERCTNVIMCKEMCDKHYSRLKTHGSTDDPRPTLEQRFWSKVDKSAGPDACWPWIAYRNPAGYGSFQMGGHNGRPHVASRIALKLSGFDLPDDRQANHHCDNPPCVNPKHLYVGNKIENYRDAAERKIASVGMSHPHSKLTDDDVREIRHLRSVGTTQQEVGDRFGITRGMVYKIENRKSWKHVA